MPHSGRKATLGVIVTQASSTYSQGRFPGPSSIVLYLTPMPRSFLRPSVLFSDHHLRHQTLLSFHTGSPLTMGAAAPANPRHPHRLNSVLCPKSVPSQEEFWCQAMSQLDGEGELRFKFGQATEVSGLGWLSVKWRRGVRSSQCFSM